MDDFERYRRAAHAMQTGVNLAMQREFIDCMSITDLPRAIKHLRVGNNARACDHTGLVRLLIAKGLISEDEYRKAMADEMELEVKRYHQDLGLPANVVLE